jgi:GNAT superfamily N-acetyltransferase
LQAKAGAPSFRIRPARPGDRALLLGLWAEADALHARLSPGYFRRTGDQEEREVRAGRIEVLRRAADALDEALLVAESGDGAAQALGFVHVHLYDTPDNLTMVRARRAHVDSVVVSASVRRRGCGTALMSEAAAWARRRGASELLLTVWEGNRAAERFYAELGYRPVSRVLGLPLGS